MAIQIQVRRDTSANWTSTNPILASGEIGYETNTNKFKFGDGSSTWTNLDYAVTLEAEGTTKITAGSTTPTSPVTGDLWIDLS